jgi:hypothetical protein
LAMERVILAMVVGEGGRGCRTNDDSRKGEEAGERREEKGEEKGGKLKEAGQLCEFLPRASVLLRRRKLLGNAVVLIDVLPSSGESRRTRSGRGGLNLLFRLRELSCSRKEVGETGTHLSPRSRSPSAVP